MLQMRIVAVLGLVATSLVACARPAAVRQPYAVSNPPPPSTPIKQPSQAGKPDQPGQPEHPGEPGQPDHPGQPEQSAQLSQSGDFALAVYVREKAVTGRRLQGARVWLPGTGIEAHTDANGYTGPIPFQLTDYERFPYEVHVSLAGYRTCEIQFGSMVFPGHAGWSQSTAAKPYQLGVYLPDGDGIATGDECYGGRTQPQTPGPNK